jgi:hypothetical protein
MKRAYMVALTTIGWFALLIQLAILIVVWDNTGGGFLQAVSRFLAYFTILTNLLVASSLTLQLYAPNSREGRFFAHPAVETGIMMAIVFVFAIYVRFLQPVWNPQGTQLLADMLLHYVVPLVYLLYWALFVPKVQLPWATALWWLIYPVGYLLYALARGAWSGFYPYFFIDVGKLGVGRVLINAVVLTVAFLLAGLLVVALGRLLSRRAPQPTSSVA